MTEDRSDLIIVGRVSGFFGVRGWVKIYSFTAPRENILRYKQWFLRTASGWKGYRLSEGQKHGKGVIVRLDDCSDRDHVASLIGHDIAIERSELPSLQEGEYYWSDLEGLVVNTIEGVTLGTIEQLLETGANDVLVVKDGEQERLLPYIPNDVVVSIDLEGGSMIVDWDPEF